MGGNALRQPSCRLDKQELLGLIVNFNNEISGYSSESSRVNGQMMIYSFYQKK